MGANGAAKVGMGSKFEPVAKKKLVKGSTKQDTSGSGTMQPKSKRAMMGSQASQNSQGTGFR